MHCIVLIACGSALASRGPLHKRKTEWTRELCRSLGTCSSCLDVEQCGWCDYGDSSSSQSSCMLAGEDGPVAPGNCTNGLWKKESCADDNCRQLPTCETCVVAQSCGWCDNVCVSTTIDHDRFCSSWETTQCPEVSCDKFTDCAACSQQSRCGWCEDQQKHSKECVVGAESGPLNTLCPQWTWKSAECSGEPLCQNFTECSSCLGSPTEDCVWCKSSETCVDAGASIECDDVQVSSCDDQCVDFVTCDACTEKEACGWCSNGVTQYCASGSESGASAPNVCSAGYYFNTCPECNTITDCGECVAYDAQNSTDAGYSCQWCRWQTIDFTMIESCFSPLDAPVSGTCMASCDGFPHMPPIAEVPTVMVQSLPMPATYHPPPPPPMEPTFTPTPSPTSTPTPVPAPVTPGMAGEPPPPPPPEEDEPDEGWELMDIILIIVVSLAAVVASALVIGMAAVAFYRYYWIRRHYYLTLR